jgi:hypothetical protein
MAGRSKLTSGRWQVGRIVEQSGGMIDNVIDPTILEDNQAHLLKNVTLEQKGRVGTCLGRTKRFTAPFDANNPCNGITAFYPDAATSRLVMGAGTKLFKDNPHLIYKWDAQADFQEAGSHRCNCDLTTTPGDIKVAAKATPTFARASVKYKKDGTLVASGAPSYEVGKFANGVHIEEATTNIINDPIFSLQASWPTKGLTAFKTTGGLIQGNCVTLSEGVSGSGFCYQGHLINIGEVITLSAYVKMSDDSEPQLSGANNYLNLVIHGLARTTYKENVGNNWWRLYATYTAETTNTLNNGIVFWNAIGTIHPICSNIQLEKKGYHTSWCNSSRNSDSLFQSLPSLLPNEWFVSGFFKPDHTSTVPRINNKMFATFINDGDSRYTVEYNHTSDILKFVKVHAGTPVHLNSPLINFSAGNTISFAAAQLTQSYGDLTAGMHLWFKIGSNSTIHVSNTDINLPIAPSKTYIGCYASTGYECNGVIDAVKLVDLKAESAMGTTINNAWAESFLTAATAPTADEATLMLCQFDDSVTPADITGFVHISAAKDISAATDTGSGKVEYANTLPGAATMTFRTRTSVDGTAWDAWTAIAGDGTINSTHNNNIQLAISGKISGADQPSLQSAQVSYDGTPGAAELQTGFTIGGQFYFATLAAKLIATNKLDAPKYWDGTAAAMTLLGGTPPHGQYVAAHKNFLFFAHTNANTSRLYFSDVLDVESYPITYFIDISPNDGDYITGLLAFDDYLIITKQHSIWVLVGSAPAEFQVRRVHSGIGCIAPRSLVRMGEFFAFVSSEGIYRSDLSSPVLLSGRLKETWKGLNRRRLNQAAAEYFDHHLRVDLPNGSSTVNNIRVIFNTIGQHMYLQELSAHASCYAKFMEAGQEILLYGHASEGQVSQADDGLTDDGAAITMTWETKHFNFGSSATIKKLKDLFLVAVQATSDVTVSIYLVVNGVLQPTPLTKVIPGSSSGSDYTAELKPRDIDVKKIRTIGYRVVQSTTNGGVKFRELIQEYQVKKVKAS